MTPNPVRRLELILTALLKTESDPQLSVALRSVLGHPKRINTLVIQTELLNLIQSAHSAIEEWNPDTEDADSYWYNQLVSTLAKGGISQPVSQFKAQVPTSVTAYLRVQAQVIDHRTSAYDIAPKDRNELHILLDSSISSIKESDLPEEEKTELVILLKRILKAIDFYSTAGPERVRQSLSELIGSLVINKELREAIDERKAVKDTVWNAVFKTAAALQISDAALILGTSVAQGTIAFLTK